MINVHIKIINLRIVTALNISASNTFLSNLLRLVFDYCICEYSWIMQGRFLKLYNTGLRSKLWKKFPSVLNVMIFDWCSLMFKLSSCTNEEAFIISGNPDYMVTCLNNSYQFMCKYLALKCKTAPYLPFYLRIYGLWSWNIVNN